MSSYSSETKSSTIHISHDGTLISSVTELSEDQFHQSDHLDGHILPPLHGRKKELSTFKNAFDRVKSQNSYEIIFVHGKSGVGKTSIVMNLREQVIENQGFFCSAKYFQNVELEAEPYSAILSIFSDLCDLTMQASDFNEDRRKEIQQALSNNAEILKKSISNISPFFDNKCDFEIDEIKIDSTVAKFKVACKAFMRAMSSDEHPNVIFLDDVQWMDKASKELLEIFLKDTEMKNLMFILAYRDEDAGLIKDTFLNQNKYTDISLGNLDVEATTEMIAAQLGSIPKEIHDLGTVIARKTQGNPFYINQFLKLIEREGLMVYDDMLCSWVYNIQKIEEETKVSDSVAELLSHKVRCLDKGTQEMLKIASLIGYHFQGDMVIEVTLEVVETSKKLKSILSLSKDSLQSLLQKATVEGILQKKKRKYQFSHDKIQASFRNLIRESEEEMLHLKIGRKFISQPDEASKYQTAIHLNKASLIHLERNGKVPIYVTENGSELAKINLDAAKYCKGRSAFSASVDFLQKSLEYIDGEEKWLKHFDLSFEIMEMLAKMELIVGNLDACKTANQEILLQAPSTEMKIKALVLEVEMYSISNDFLGVTAATKKLLKHIGVNLPRRVTIINLFHKLRKVRTLIDRKKDEEILLLQRTNDSKVLTAIRVVMLACWVCYGVQKHFFGIYLTLVAAELTMEHGISQYSSIAFYMYGIAEILYGNRERGHRLGALSIKLHSYIECKDSGCAMIGGTIFHSTYLKENVRKYFGLHWKALNNAFKVGDLNAVTICLFPFFNTMLWSGDNLAHLERIMLDLHGRICDLGHNQEENLKRINPMIQFVLNMQNEEEDWEILTKMNGTIMTEENYLSGSKIEIGVYWITVFSKIVLYFTFGFYGEAEKLVRKLSGTSFTHKTYFSLPYNYYAAMISYRLYESKKSKRYLRNARKFKKFLVNEDSLGNPNATPHLRGLEIEELSLKSKNLSEIVEACNNAIWLQSKEGFVHLEAMTNEQAYRIVHKLNSNIAQKYFRQALHAYRFKWGATAKYRLLLKEHENLEMKYDICVKEVNSISFLDEKDIPLSIDISSNHTSSHMTGDTAKTSAENSY